MGLSQLRLMAYGRCKDVVIDVGQGLTVVLGANEAGKSTALSALTDLFWGIPLKTAHASEFPRQQLRIDAELDLAGARHTVSRRAGGLFGADGAGEVVSPWDPDGRLDRLWWRTRLGIDHTDLVRGGAAVFGGTGDLAELIFAAREGRNARALLAEITGEIEKIYKAHRGSRNVQLRVATREYQQVVKERDERITRADEVVAQQQLVHRLEDELAAARTAVAAATRALRRAEEDQRVIGPVLELRRVQAQLESLAAEGDRLTPDELIEYADATDALASSARRLGELDTEIAGRVRDIEALAVDDDLLADKTTLDRLQADAKARIAELDRADGEFRPAVAEETRRLCSALAEIGVTAGADDAALDTALAGVRVRTDHAATLDDLADRLEHWQAQRQEALAEQARVLAELAAKGIRVQVDGAVPFSEESIGRLRDELGAAHTERATAEELLTDARRRLAEVRSEAPEPQRAAEIGRTEVATARAARDSAWAVVRRAWLTGALPEAGDRVDQAGAVDRALEHGDRIVDDEAAERSRVAAQDARIGAHVEGLEAAQRAERAAEEKLAAVAERYRGLERQWSALWTGLGLAEAPSVDSGPVLAGLILSAEAAKTREESADARLAELAGPWASAAGTVGLPAGATTAAWRRRAEIIEQIGVVAERRQTAREREEQARAGWTKFCAEVGTVLGRHGGVADPAALTPALVEHGLTELAGRLDTALAAGAERTAYRKELDRNRAEHKAVQQAQRDADDLLARLARQHAVAAGPELDALAARAGRATEPQAIHGRARNEIASGLDRGSDLEVVVDRLADADQVAVDQVVQQARAEEEAARAAADAVVEQCTSARDRLTVLQAAAGAADAEVEVAMRQAAVAQLTESWALLTLQKTLLEDVLEELGSDETRPLLDQAGRILERLTDGRWVALRAEEDGDTRKLLVVRSDAVRLGTAELSEGTADQVFLALRLAAVAELHAERTAAGEPALPLVLDDVLMTFDEERTLGALQVLAELAPGLQVIVFTHHRHVAEAAGALAGVTVSELPSAAEIVGRFDAAEIRARMQQGAAALTQAPESAARTGQPDARAVREWAQREGIEVNAKGRVPREIVERYLAAGPEPVPAG